MLAIIERFSKIRLSKKYAINKKKSDIMFS